MNLEMNEDFAFSLCFTVAMLCGAALIAYGCNRCTETEKEYIRQGYIQTPSPGGSTTYWTKGTNTSN